MTLRQIAMLALDEFEGVPPFQADALVDVQDYGTSEGVRKSWSHRLRRLPVLKARKLKFSVVDVPRSSINSEKSALDWAVSHFIVGIMPSETTGHKGLVSISRESIREMVNPNQRLKSSSVSIHYDAVQVLRELISESHIVESHPDYKKGPDGVRSAKYGVVPGIMIDVAYGAMRQGKNYYRVKITLKRYDDKKRNNKAYAYQVTEIEVLPGMLVGVDDGSNPKGRTSITGNILLQGAHDVNGGSLV